MVEEIIQWLIGILSIVFAIIFVTAGYKMVTSAGNASAKEGAKKMISNAFIGFVIVLACWLLIDFMIKALVGGSDIGSYGPWNSVECVDQPQSAINFTYGSFALTEAAPTGAAPGAFGAGTGMGTQGSCVAAAAGPCSVAALEAAGFSPALAAQASQIAGAESGCNTNAESRTDTTTDGRTYSVGVWQINLGVHKLNCPGYGSLDCPSAFQNTGLRNKYNVRVKKVVNEALYTQCVAAAKDPACNNNKAAELANRSGDMGDWACSARKCDIYTTRNNLCPL